MHFGFVKGQIMVAADTEARWQVDPADFPLDGTYEDILRFALNYAVLAPSSHNSQPWRFWVGGPRVELYADPSRRLPVVDPDDRELVMSCAATLRNLRVALNHFGEEIDTVILPDPRKPDLLARLELTGRPVMPTPHTEDEFAAITRRHTSRHAFDDTPVTGQVFLDLRRAAFDEGAWLFEVPRQEHRALAYLVTDGDTAQMADAAFRRELAHWMRPNLPASADGMPGYALGYSEIQSIVGPLVVRTFDVGLSQAARDEDLVRGSPLLAIVSTPGDDRTSWMAAGQAMQSVLLTATAAGLKASFLNQPIEVPALRTRLAAELGLAGNPQLLMRLGYGPAGAPTPRHPVEDVLLPERPS
jgi:Nitroreductase family